MSEKLPGSWHLLDLSAVGSPAKMCPMLHTDEVRESMAIARAVGKIWWNSYMSSSHSGSSSRTSLGPQLVNGCPACGMTSIGPLDIPLCQWRCPPLRLGRRSPAIASLSLPSPTAKGNQLAPSMRKWPSCRRLQDLIGIGGAPHPGIWEWMMGFPEGWTDVEPSETPSSLKSRKSSDD